MERNEAARYSDPVCNAISVDVEDWFQVQAFAGTIDRSDWERMPDRVERNTMKVMEILGCHGVRATFFILGWVAQRHPRLVRQIVEAGHEIASHGLQHIQVFRQSPDEFRRDVEDTKALLEDTSGQAVLGYRAASFSIGRDTPWAHAELEAAGYRYSSSIYPIRHDLYGMEEAPRFAFTPPGASKLVELPITTVLAGDRKLPCGGGGYFRLLPYGISRLAMRRVNRIDGRPCIFYFHPWEVDPDQPRPQRVPLKSRFRHYTNLGRMEARLDRLLTDFPWDRMDRVFASHISQG